MPFLIFDPRTGKRLGVWVLTECNDPMKQVTATHFVYRSDSSGKLCRAETSKVERRYCGVKPKKRVMK